MINYNKITDKQLDKQIDDIFSVWEMTSEVLDLNKFYMLVQEKTKRKCTYILKHIL